MPSRSPPNTPSRLSRQRCAAAIRVMAPLNAAQTASDHRAQSNKCSGQPPDLAGNSQANGRSTSAAVKAGLVNGWSGSLIDPAGMSPAPKPFGMPSGNIPMAHQPKPIASRPAAPSRRCAERTPSGRASAPGSTKGRFPATRFHMPRSSVMRRPHPIGESRTGIAKLRLPRPWRRGGAQSDGGSSLGCSFSSSECRAGTEACSPSQRTDHLAGSVTTERERGCRIDDSPQMMTRRHGALDEACGRNEVT